MESLADGRAGFGAFVAPARRAPAVWRLVLGTAGAILIWLLAAGFLLGVASRTAAGDPRVVLLAYLASFAFLLTGAGLAARLLQGRSVASLLGPGGFRLRHFLLGAAVVVILGGFTSAVALGFAQPVRRAGIAAWVAWLPAALPLLLVQAAAEEVLFRGFLMQTLAARFRSRAVWLVLPAVLFGLMHWSPASGSATAVATVAGTALIGFVLAEVTVRTGNLSAAIGLHFANNCLALLFVSAQPELSALSLYVIPPGRFRDLAPLADIAVTLLAYAIWRRALRARTES